MVVWVSGEKQNFPEKKDKVLFVTVGTYMMGIANGATRIVLVARLRAMTWVFRKTVSACIRGYDRNAKRGSSIDAE